MSDLQFEGGSSLQQGPTSPSAEFIEWRSAREAYWSTAAASEQCFNRRIREYRDRRDLPAAIYKQMFNTLSFLRVDREYKSLEAAQIIAEERLDAAVASIEKRPVRSLKDLAEFSKMVRGERRWNSGDYDPNADNAPDPSVIAVFDAIAALAVSVEED